MAFIASASAARTRRSVIGLALLALGSAHGQSDTAGPGRVCERALSDLGAHLAVPVLSSMAVREATCSCVAAGLPEPPTAASAPLAQAAIDARVGDCIAQAAPAERISALPAAVLAQLEEALSPDPSARAFRKPVAVTSSCQIPAYPEVARRAEATGTTRLGFHIRADATRIDGDIVRSAGPSAAHKLLDMAALLALMTCRFEPARFRGQALDAWVELEYRWKLD